MSRRVIAKWRPPLALVLGGTLAAVFFLPIIGISYFRLAGGVLGYAETAWLIAWMALVATCVLGFFLWRLVLRPMRRLTEFALSEGAVTAPVHFGTPEFSRLGQAVIEMTETLQNRESVLRSYADHVTHELKSPLTVIRGAAELLDDPTLSDAERTRMTANIIGATARMEALLESQRAFARAQDPMPRGSCLLSQAAPKRGVEIDQDGQTPFSVDVLGLVLNHLVSNAQAHGATIVRLAAYEGRLVVADNGAGVSAGNRDRIFDPFFTTRRDVGGTGMGLPIVRRILQAQGADIRLIDGPGAVFEINY